MGLVWAGATADEIGAARRDLVALRTPAGSWPQLPGYQADAYSTGEALYALHEAGMAVSDRVWSAGLKFLLSTQAVDGTWRVHTRMISPMQVSPTYFDSGFPYGKDEYLSYAGSSWAVMALIESLPVTAETPSLSGAANVNPAWVRTALFGSPHELTSLLDSGLSPNSKTDKGTTLLMMAAPDPEKVRLLLARGADAKARTGSGVDALAIATAYRGTAGSVQALLDAGVPASVRARHSPMVLASMTGDLDNVKLLLAHGADPSPGLSQAVTYGYPDVTRALIAAGASAAVSESSGINLVHWAAMTNHPEVIPVLAQAGASVNATDEFNYTPLMYAATIDFGDAEVVKALLKAGADPKIRNDQGRTALEQARFYKHSLIEAALR
jgi:ankyrin repeat protein